ncbi:unnamed protein product [Polarella glacialis]|uniref:Uncharacterized protein n=1 Tax=Polarella glacialis TaxID=89957 RepID=A0A813G7N7_POLGL|nr:unnamed protein product [Polarella glacialis]
MEADGPSAASSPSESSSSTVGLHIVAQRCGRARLLVDEASDTWTEIGRGLILYVSFAKGSAATAGATSELAVRCLRQAAKSVLTAPLASSGQWQADHADAESIVALCRRGEAQAVLLVPQASLVSKLELGEKNLKYHQQCPKEIAADLFHGLAAALGSVARELICGTGPKHDAASYEALCAQRAAASLIAPEEMFKSGEYADKYSQYDERGVPTHASDGSEVPKSAQKKLEKIFAAQVKKYAKAAESGVARAVVEDGVETEDPPVVAPVAADQAEVSIPEGACLPDVRHGTFGGRQGFEMTSSGPLTHSFVF